jgi:hypothetical protein
MDFYAILDQVVDLLRQRQFQLDNAFLEDVKSNSSRANGWQSMRATKSSSGSAMLIPLPYPFLSQRRCLGECP